MQKFY